VKNLFGNPFYFVVCIVVNKLFRKTKFTEAGAKQTQVG